MVICLSKKTTVLLDDDIYIKLVNLSIRKYGSTRYISRVINELLSEALKKLEEKNPLDELKELLSGPKLAEISPEEFEKFRRELSRRFES